MPFADPRWTRGVELFNREEFFDAHEVVEDLWNETSGPEREFLKGFIQASVALEHHRRGNRPGFRSVWGTASGYLRRADPSSGGLDVEGLVRDFEEFRSRVERGESPPFPRARMRNGGTPGGENVSAKDAPVRTPAGSPTMPAGPVNLTPLAAERLKAMAEEQAVPADERNLRIALRVGGCSGFSYEMGFDRARDGDVVSESHGVRVVVDPKDLGHLQGLVVDFVDTVQEQGFKISNPNAKSSCGCGQSFQA